MILGWIIGIIAILALVFVVVSDGWTRKNLNYFQIVHKPTGKTVAIPEISTKSKHDEFYYKLNS